MARYIAKNIRCRRAGSKCEVQLAYAIGVADPVSVLVDTKEHGEGGSESLDKLVPETFPADPRGIIDHLETASAHFQEDGRLWTLWSQRTGVYVEKTDKAKALRKDAGL